MILVPYKQELYCSFISWNCAPQVCIFIGNGLHLFQRFLDEECELHLSVGIRINIKNVGMESLSVYVLL